MIWYDMTKKDQNENDRTKRSISSISSTKSLSFWSYSEGRFSEVWLFSTWPSLEFVDTKIAIHEKVDKFQLLKRGNEENERRKEYHQKSEILRYCQHLQFWIVLFRLEAKNRLVDCRQWDLSKKKFHFKWSENE